MNPELKILLVDDDSDGLCLLGKILWSKFPEACVVECRSGETAFETLQTQSFSVIVTNHRLMEMDGLTLIKKIREIDGDVPIIMSTGMDNLRERALAAGATYFLPLEEWRQLAAVVEHLLAARCGSPQR